MSLAGVQGQSPLAFHFATHRNHAECYIAAMDTNAAIAFNRFGLGRRRDEPVPVDPRAWLTDQLAGPDTAPTQGLLSSSDALGMLRALIEAKKDAPMVDGKKEPTPEARAFNQHTKAEVAALLAQAITTPAGFRERLVWFWANHFTVAMRSRPASACAGAFVREAIRPYVNGRFADMLLAVERHPAMMAYLDQPQSVGEHSLVGERKPSRAEREPGARVPGTAHGHARFRLHAGGCDRLRPHPDRQRDRHGA